MISANNLSTPNYTEELGELRTYFFLIREIRVIRG